MMDVMTPDELAQWEADLRHSLAAVSEGLCPVHAVPLVPGYRSPAVWASVTGHCADCRKHWWADFSTNWCGWILDCAPHTMWNRYAPEYYTRSVLA